ncbi:L,D-transpeptidase family protein [Sphingomonas astaxanthinifaciens]|uniref:L,D-transpeptidase family protein n=1 Tax=Sphingomonas astaxanthinifaciens TaxID=407019 RepID=UPI00068CA930|nr:L,D-transpeptidase family protein [Sphingomonas astaxanthinifaciens]
MLGAAAAIAALTLSVPAAAATVSAESLPTAAAVSSFYAGRSQPLWLESPRAIGALTAALKTSPLDGFEDGPELAASIEQALADAEAGTPGAAQEAERLMSSAFILYAQAMRWPGGAKVIYADPALAPKVPTPAEVLAGMARSDDLAALVRRTAEVNPIHAALKAAAAEDSRFLGEPSRAMRGSLDRARLLPSDGRFVLVDIASQQLMMIDEGKVVDRMKVVVGKPEMKTPLMAGTLRQVTFNPYWNVPVDLAASNIAPNVLRQGVGWLKAKNYEVLSGWDADARVIDPASVDWQAVADGRIEARVRQKPGRGNMMGAMKFEFPNELGIYLHDTPARNLFDEAARTFSSGCVRLEDAPRLGRWLMGRDAVAASSQPELNVALGAGVPVFLTYLTVRPEADGSLAYAPDIYGLDNGEEPKLAAVR